MKLADYLDSYVRRLEDHPVFSIAIPIIVPILPPMVKEGPNSNAAISEIDHISSTSTQADFESALDCSETHKTLQILD